MRIGLLSIALVAAVAATASAPAGAASCSRATAKAAVKQVKALDMDEVHKKIAEHEAQHGGADTAKA